MNKDELIHKREKIIVSTIYFKKTVNIIDQKLNFCNSLHIFSVILNKLKII